MHVWGAPTLLSMIDLLQLAHRRRLAISTNIEHHGEEAERSEDAILWDGRGEAEGFGQGEADREL